MNNNLFSCDDCNSTDFTISNTDDNNIWFDSIAVVKCRCGAIYHIQGGMAVTGGDILSIKKVNN